MVIGSQVNFSNMVIVKLIIFKLGTSLPSADGLTGF